MAGIGQVAIGLALIFLALGFLAGAHFQHWLEHRHDAPESED